MARRIALPLTAQHPDWLLWCLASLGACSGALLVISGAAVRTEVGKLGAVNSYEFQVRVFGLTAHRTTVVAARQGPSTLLSQLQALSQAWGGSARRRVRAGRWIGRGRSGAGSPWPIPALQPAGAAITVFPRFKLAGGGPGG